MASTFLLLEITDPEVNALLWQMRRIVAGVSGKQSRTAVHLTVRGPYTSEPDPDVLTRAKAQMAGDVLRIYGAGRFSNPDGEVVFLHVHSPHLHDVWWKPSFSEFNPHISIYKGTDKALADVVELFLAEAGLDLLCAEYRLVWHRSGQRNLFDSNEPTVGAMQTFFENGRLDPALLDRLSEAIGEHLARLRHA
jgi:hypothetical protein